MKVGRPGKFLANCNWHANANSGNSYKRNNKTSILCFGPSSPTEPQA